MTVENSVSKTPKLVMGAKTYDFNFDVLLEDPTAEEARRAIKCSISNGTEETELIYGTDYTVTLNSDKKGGVVTVTDVKDDRWHIVIYRQYNMTQGVDLNDYNEFPAETIERAFDKQTMLIQELKEIAERSVKVTPANNQTPEELLDEVYSKLDSATEVATNAIAAATLATTAAESATKAVEDAEQQVAEVTKYIDDKKVEIDGIVVDAQNSVDGAINQATEDVKTAATEAAEAIIQDAGQTATNIAVDYVNTTVKPELQGISDNAEQYATNSRESANASKESAQTSQTYADNSKIWAEGADNSVSALGGTHSSKRWNELCSDLKASTQLSEQNAKRYAESINPDNLLNKQMITNCLTHIPQDIKLELVNGTLTGKQGSMVWIPYGTTEAYQVGDTDTYGNTVVATSWDGSKFFYAIKLLSDVSFSSGSPGVNSNQRTLVYNAMNNSFGWQTTNLCKTTSSSETFTDGGLYYNTSTNVIKVNNNQSSGDNYSLPICLFTAATTAGVVDSIDQTFNGFGYIGSTVFALPGVKGLIPDGRNADGSLKNIEFETENLLTYTITGANDSVYLVFADNGSRISYATKTHWTYDKDTNSIIGDNVIKKGILFAGSLEVFNKKATSFTPKTTFQAVDRNDTSWLSGLGMPSGKYIDLTLGASGSKYTAPANGYFSISKSSSASSHQVTLENDTTKLTSKCVSTIENQPIGVFLPAKKGDVVGCYHSAPTARWFRFIYAEGETE